MQDDFGQKMSEEHFKVKPQVPIMTMAMYNDRVDIDFAGEPEGHGVLFASDEAKRIMITHLERWVVLFLAKNRKYAEVQKGYDLGAAGIIPDINRKLGILYDRLWKGREMPTDERGRILGEPTDEVIMDTIGHLFLLMDKIAPVYDES
jgi:hypothetical protein